jgi:hypothetical protein
VRTTAHQSPRFGYDPWLGPNPPPLSDVLARELAPVDLATLSATTGTPVYTGADALTGDIILLPADLNAYMSYVDNYGGWGQLVARFAHTNAYLVSITIFGGVAHCADVESGAMVDSDLAHWYDTAALKPDGRVPWVYTNAANRAACDAAMGQRPHIKWSAHVGFGPHICSPTVCGYPQADWTQWAFSGAGGQNIDRSVGTYLPARPGPVVKDMFYERYATGPFGSQWGDLDERLIVKRYDGAREHWLKYKLYLPKLRAQCEFLAERVRKEAVEQPVDGKPSNGLFYRGWRRAMLQARADGNSLTG